jgi:biotin carboxylase
LGAGAGQLGALRAARRLGVDVVACDQNPAPAAVLLGLLERVEPVSSMDEEGVERTARRVGAAGLLAPGTDRPVRLAARVAARVGLPHPISPELAERATDKLLQRQAFAAAGVPQPPHRLDSVEGLRPPLAIKAADGWGQRGLTLVHDPRQAAAALAEARTASPSGRALVEELVDGQEITVNAFHLDGRFVPLTVTDRERALAFGVATAHLYPAARGAAEATAAAEAACAALGLRQGPSYTQVVMGPEGPAVMEVAARLGGGQDAELCHAALGVDLAALAVRSALGETPAEDELQVTRERPALVRFLVAEPGVVERVEGLEEAAAVPGVLDVLSYRGPGDTIEPLRVGADRVGFVLAVGDTRAQAEAAAAEAARLVCFVLG